MTPKRQNCAPERIRDDKTARICRTKWAELQRRRLQALRRPPQRFHTTKTRAEVHFDTKAAIRELTHYRARSGNAKAGKIAYANATPICVAFRQVTRQLRTGALSSTRSNVLGIPM